MSCKLLYVKYFVLLFILLNYDIKGQNNEVGFGVSVIDYGARPAKNWADATDNSRAIQTAIDDNPGRMILIPSGIYLLSFEIKVKHGVKIVGEDKYATILQPLKSNCFVVNSGGVSIENLFIYGRGFTGITVNAVRNTNINNVLLQNVETGILLKNAWSTKINNVDITINPNQNPKVLKGIVLEGQSVNNFISNSQITAQQVGIEIKKSEKKSEGLMINNCLISQSKTGIKSFGILSLQINNSIIDLCEEFALEIYDTAGLLASNNWIVSNGHNNSQAIKLSSSWDSHFSANNIKCNTCSSVISIVNYSNNNIFSNNTFEMIDLENPIINLDKSASVNLLKDNNFKAPKSSPHIINNGSDNKILDNLNSNLNN